MYSNNFFTTNRVGISDESDPIKNIIYSYDKSKILYCSSMGIEILYNSEYGAEKEFE